MRWTQRIGQVAKSPPDQTKRPVGTYDVTPTEGGVHVGGSDRVAVPESLQDELKARAREGHTDEPVTLTTAIQYQHDLDTRATSFALDNPEDTAPERHRPSPAELAAASCALASWTFNAYP